MYIQGQKISSLRTTIADVSVVRLQAVFEPRGNLIVGERGKHFPFIPKRFFVVSEVPPHEVRGNHAHYTQQQFLVLVQGACNFVVEDGRACKELVLDHPDTGVHIPPQIWTSYSCSPDTILLVLASDLYDAEDYVRDFDEFVRFKWGALPPVLYPHNI